MVPHGGTCIYRKGDEVSGYIQDVCSIKLSEPINRPDNKESRSRFKTYKKVGDGGCIAPKNREVYNWLKKNKYFLARLDGSINCRDVH